ncbi:unnamed protein product [Callosobruchus maculatus]|uniref:CWF21 domain-containing protein n=1 Tax=Callosobruchus maculatus TaxID=64391 RepID=A0A653BX68_CALMS|nr:unnamed protein product [Callosobruchus maculatus]
MMHYESSGSGEEDLDGKKCIVVFQRSVKQNINDCEEIAEDGQPKAPLSGFIASKWEAVDPDQVEAQAMTTSKWDMLENSQDASQESSANERDDSVDYSDTRNMTEEKRQKLREIEVKAVQYQDELESGQRQLKSGWTLPQQVEHYRRKLLRKSEKEKKEKSEKSSKEKHKKERDYDRSERRVVVDSSDDETYYKEVTSRKSKKHARSSSSGSTSRHR